MRNKILAALAVLTCGVFIASPICAAAALPELLILFAETSFSDFIARSAETDEDGNRKGFVGALRDYQSLIPEGCFLNPIIADDDISFRVPNYYVITGKMHLTDDFVYYDDNDTPYNTVTANQVVECSILCMDGPSAPSDYWKKRALTKESGTGKYLFGDALNFRVTDNLGNETNFVMLCRDSLYNHIHVVQNYVAVSTSHYDVYMYSGDTLTQLIYTNQYNHGLRFNHMTTNTIDRSVQYLSARPTSNDYFGNDSSGYITYGEYSTSTPKSRLDIKDIVNGRVFMAYKRKSTASNSSWLCVTTYPLDYMFNGFIVTNNNTAERTMQNNWTALSTQNYYIDNIFEGNTIIDKNNYFDFGGGAFAPVFTLTDIDLPSLPLDDILDILTDLLPDVVSGLQPSIDIGLDSLFDRLFDYYANMPDIGLEWSPDLDINNYWDVELPVLPDSGGSGSISVNVDITRPLVSEVVTSYWLSVDVSTETTATYPVAVVSAMPELWQKSDVIINSLELMPVYGLLATVGVAVAVLYKGV